MRWAAHIFGGEFAEEIPQPLKGRNCY